MAPTPCGRRGYPPFWRWPVRSYGPDVNEKMSELPKLIGHCCGTAGAVAA